MRQEQRCATSNAQLARTESIDVCQKVFLGAVNENHRVVVAILLTHSVGVSSVACYRPTKGVPFLRRTNGTPTMFSLLFSVLVIIALVSTAIHFAMRIRLMRSDAASDRIEWLSFRGSTEVLDTYKALFPRSVLPRFCRFAFWTAVFCAAVILCAVILKSR